MSRSIACRHHCRCWGGREGGEDKESNSNSDNGQRECHSCLCYDVFNPSMMLGFKFQLLTRMAGFEIHSTYP